MNAEKVGKPPQSAWKALENRRRGCSAPRSRAQVWARGEDEEGRDWSSDGLIVTINCVEIVRKVTSATCGVGNPGLEKCAGKTNPD
jgi:hypothetical protein